MEVLSNLGNALAKLKDYQHAWVAFDEALKISPANTQIIENYLLCLLEGRQFEQFDEMLAKIKFLGADVKTRLQRIAEEYRTTLGVRAKKGGKKLGSPLGKRASFLAKTRKMKNSSTFSEGAST